MLGSASNYQQEDFVGKVSGPCQCEDLLVIKPDERFVYFPVRNGVNYNSPDFEPNMFK